MFEVATVRFMIFRLHECRGVWWCSLRLFSTVGSSVRPSVLLFWVSYFLEGILTFFVCI